MPCNMLMFGATDDLDLQKFSTLPPTTLIQGTVFIF